MQFRTVIVIISVTYVNSEIDFQPSLCLQSPNVVPRDRGDPRPTDSGSSLPLQTNRVTKFLYINEAPHTRRFTDLTAARDPAPTRRFADLTAPLDPAPT